MPGYVSGIPSIKISIPGTNSFRDISSKVQIDTLDIQETIPAAGDSCTFTIEIDPESEHEYIPEPSSIVRIEITDGDEVTKIFEGPVTIVSQGISMSGSSIAYNVTCQDYTLWLNRRMVFGQRGAERASSRIAWLINTFALGADGTPLFTMNNVDTNPNTDVVVDADDYQYVSIGSILDRLIDSTSHGWYVDFDRDLHFYVSEDKLSPLAEKYNNVLHVDGNEDVGDIEFSWDVSQLKNVVIIKDFAKRGDAKRTDDFLADGRRSFWKLYYPPWDQDVEVTVDGIPYVVIRDPLTDENGQITGSNPGVAFVCVSNWGIRFSMADIPAEGQLIRVEYYPEETDNQVRVFFDDDSRRMVQYYEGDNSPGWYEFVYDASNLRVVSEDTLNNLAMSILAKTAWPVLQGRFNTFLPGWRSGQFFWLASAEVDSEYFYTNGTGPRDVYDRALFWKTGGYQNGEAVGAFRAVPCYVTEVSEKLAAVGNGKYLLRTTISFSNMLTVVRGI